MKKILLIIAVMLASSWGLVAQNVLLNETMESYAVDSFLGVVNPNWFTTWSNLPGSGEDAQVLTTFAHGGTKAASADLTGGQTDCLLKLGNKTTGNYELKWWMYVENDKCGYYNIQHFEEPGLEWAFDIYFRTAGAVELTAGSVVTNGTYPKATWFEVKHIIKLDVDSIYLYINGSLLYAWPFHYENSGTAGTNQLGSVDFWAGAFSGSGETPGYYFDDIVFTELEVTGVNELKNQSVSVYPNPNDGQFTVKLTSSKQESFNISVINTNGVRIMELRDVVVNGNVEKSIDLRPVPAGIYSVVIRNNESVVVKKIVVR